MLQRLNAPLLPPLTAPPPSAGTPGPTIRCTVGETLSVRVKNKLDMETTIHW